MSQPTFDSLAFLQSHVDDTLRFYEPTSFDANGGFFHYFKDDGSVYNRSHRHLVSATRFVFNWAQAQHHTSRAPYRDWAAHALEHLQRFVIAQGPAQGLHAWTLQDGQIEDATSFAYGQAFVLLARAHAHRVGLCSAADVARAFDAMGDAFWREADGAYADRLETTGVPESFLVDPDGRLVRRLRGPFASEPDIARFAAPAFRADRQGAAG